jgi:hypothetical protein
MVPVDGAPAQSEDPEESEEESELSLRREEGGEPEIWSPVPFGAGVEIFGDAFKVLFSL